MSTILFDGTSMQSEKHVKFHGGGEYAKFILKAALDAGYTFDVALNPDMFLDDTTLNIIRKHKLNTIYVHSKEELYGVIDAGGYRVFYSALPYNYFDYRAHADFIGVLHGLRPLEIVWDKYRHKYSSNRLKALVIWLIWHSGWIKGRFKLQKMQEFSKLLSIPRSTFITVSNHTKYALLNFFSAINTERIKVFYSPFETLSCTPHCGKEADKYFLLVSGNRFEKNTYRAMKAFDKLFSDGRLAGFEVVVTGAENLPFRGEIKNKHRFRMLPYVDTERLARLYAGAFCFFYPSLNEGFGYPPLLAMSADTPVIASSATSIPEVCGNAAMYFSPENIDDMRNRILQISADVEKREELIKAGRERVAFLQQKQQRELSEYLALVFGQLGC
jgi:glycosyltransferase involved in cell wall biosynthesis